MPEDEITKNLSARIAILEARLGSETVRIDNCLAISGQLPAIQQQLALNQRMATEAQAVSQNVSQNLFRISVIAAAVGAALTFFGYHTAEKYFAEAKETISFRFGKLVDSQQRRLNELADYEDEYASGTGLLGARNYEAAIPHLKRCFDNYNHTYDPTVLIPLLNAIDQAGEYEDGREIITKLRRDSLKFDKIADVLALDDIGLVEMDIGQQHQEYLPFAHADLEKALKRVPEGDEEDRRYIYQNLWTYSILTHNQKEADRYISELLRINDPTIDAWEQVKAYPFFKEFLANSATISERVFAEKSWKKLELARKKSL